MLLNGDDLKVLRELKKGEVKTDTQGFLLLAVGKFVRDLSLTILTVKIEASEVESVKLLGTGRGIGTRHPSINIHLRSTILAIEFRNH
jgi:hypothetical protein